MSVERTFESVSISTNVLNFCDTKLFSLYQRNKVIGELGIRSKFRLE